MTRWGLVVLLCGCDDLFNLVEVQGAGSGAIDAATDVATADAEICGQMVSDPFSGTVISQNWDKFEELPTLHVMQQNGELVIDLTDAALSSADGEAGVMTPAKVDMRNGYVSVEVTQVVGGVEYNVEDYLDLYFDPDNAYRFETNGGYLQVYSKVNTIQTREFQRSYDAIAHRFFRIESDAGGLQFRTSEDGTSYYTQHVLTPAFALDAVHIRLVAGTFDGGEADPGMAKFDNFRYCGN
jgi:hypothetical protein